MKNIMRNLLCSNLKRKIKITNSLLVAFLITGGISFGAGEAPLHVSNSVKVHEGNINEMRETVDNYGEHIGALDNFVNYHDQRITNNEEKISDHGMAIKALMGNKADKVETEKALGEVRESANKERKDRLSNERTLNRRINSLDKKIKVHEDAFKSFDGGAKDAALTIEENQNGIDVLMDKTDAQDKKIAEMDKMAKDNDATLKDTAMTAAENQDAVDSLLDRADATEKRMAKVEKTSGRVAAHEQYINGLTERANAQEGKLDDLNKKVKANEDAFKNFDGGAKDAALTIEENQNGVDRLIDKTDATNKNVEKLSKDFGATQTQVKRNSQVISALLDSASRGSYMVTGDVVDGVKKEETITKEDAEQMKKDHAEMKKTTDSIMTHARVLDAEGRYQGEKINEHDEKLAAQDKKLTEHDTKLATNKKSIDSNTKQITKNKKDIEFLANTKYRREEINRNTQAINQNTRAINRINSRLDHMDNKINQGMSLMAAMTAIDFQSVGAGEVGIGAGVGHYVNSEGVAIGVAYAPTDVFRVNAKYSVTTGSIHNSAVAVGATYKFKLR
ncbi:MAG: YadA-like family protein [Cetobacterium sp.]|nr:YadA-like family protein [Cetobacterium sp.]